MRGVYEAKKVREVREGKPSGRALQTGFEQFRGCGAKCTKAGNEGVKLQIVTNIRDAS
jgi:hypothetical protein